MPFRGAEFGRTEVLLDHIARLIVNADHGIMSPAAVHRVADCILDRVRLAITTSDQTAAVR